MIGFKLIKYYSNNMIFPGDKLFYWPTQMPAARDGEMLLSVVGNKTAYHTKKYVITNIFSFPTCQRLCKTYLVFVYITR